MNETTITAPAAGSRHPLTPRQIAVIRASWRRVLPIAELAAALFYRRLFELDPRIQSLFPVDTREQGRKLMTMLGMVVAELDRLDALVPAVERLGRRHVGYGVEDGHYDTVGVALLDTLRVRLGDQFDAEAEAAWSTAYGVLATVMRRVAM